MKFINKLKYTLLLLLGMFQLVSAQVVFHEDFGSSTVRLPSMFVPQIGNDSNIGDRNFSHGSKFYRFADLNPDLTSDTENRININDGYYAVGNPLILKTGASWANNDWWSFKKFTTDHTTGTMVY